MKPYTCRSQRRHQLKLILGCLLLQCFVSQSLAESGSVDKTYVIDRTYEIGIQAYIYAYPMVMMEMTRRASTNVESPGRGGAPMNQFVHVRRFPDHNFKKVVRSNVDTLFSVAWFDVSQEPQILSIPGSSERYYVFSMHDMWTDVFAAPGVRTSGIEAAKFGIVGPGWKRSLPDGVERLDSPTKMGWIIGRFRSGGGSDFENVHKLQDKISFVPLSHWNKGQRGKAYTPPAAVPLNTGWDMTQRPSVQVEQMSAAEYFELFSSLINDHGSHESDWNMLKLLEQVGIVVGEKFDFSKLPKATQTALQKASRDASKIIDEKKSRSGELVNGWQLAYEFIGNYGTSYLQRANIARIGLGANVPGDAIYPISFADNKGRPYHGTHSYNLHFNKQTLPPVNGFWSLTMYGSEGYFVENPIKRYAIGDRNDLEFNADGSLDIIIQHDSPGGDNFGGNKESNWLPAPAGEFNLLLRLYWPKPEILRGDWVPPGVDRIE